VQVERVADLNLDRFRKWGCQLIVFHYLDFDAC
jgi:hypothetical protein